MFRLHCPLIPFHRDPPLGPGVPPPDPAEPPEPTPMDLPPMPERDHPVYHRPQRLQRTGSLRVYRLHRDGTAGLRGFIGTSSARARLRN